MQYARRCHNNSTASTMHCFIRTLAPSILVPQQKVSLKDNDKAKKIAGCSFLPTLHLKLQAHPGFLFLFHRRHCLQQVMNSLPPDTNLPPHYNCPHTHPRVVAWCAQHCQNAVEVLSCFDKAGPITSKTLASRKTSTAYPASDLSAYLCGSQHIRTLL